MAASSSCASSNPTLIVTSESHSTSQQAWLRSSENLSCNRDQHTNDSPHNYDFIHSLPHLKRSRETNSVVVNSLGKGGFGRVYTCLSHRYGIWCNDQPGQVAVKRVALNFCRKSCSDISSPHSLVYQIKSYFREINSTLSLKLSIYKQTVERKSDVTAKYRMFLRQLYEDLIVDINEVNLLVYAMPMAHQILKKRHHDT